MDPTSLKEEMRVVEEGEVREIARAAAAAAMAMEAPRCRVVRIIVHDEDATDSSSSEDEDEEGEADAGRSVKRSRVLLQTGDREAGRRGLLSLPACAAAVHAAAGVGASVREAQEAVGLRRARPRPPHPTCRGGQPRLSCPPLRPSPAALFLLGTNLNLLLVPAPPRVVIAIDANVDNLCNSSDS